MCFLNFRQFHERNRIFMSAEIMHLYHRLVIMNIVFFEFVFAQPNFCPYEEDYYEYVPKTVNVLRKKPKKQKSSWSYLNPLNLFASQDEYVAVKETQMTLEKKKRTVAACCTGFKKNGNQCVSASDSPEKSTLQSVTVSASTASSALAAPSTSAQTIASKPAPTEGLTTLADSSSSSNAVPVTTAGFLNKTDPPTAATSAASPEPAAAATAATLQASADQQSTEVSAETKPQSSTVNAPVATSAVDAPAATSAVDAPAATSAVDATAAIESNSKPPPEEKTILPAETVENAPTSSISQQTTVTLKNQDMSTLRSSTNEPSSEITTFPAEEVTSVVTKIGSKGESTTSTAEPLLSSSLATQQDAISDAVNPTTPTDVIIASAASQTTLATTESAPVTSGIRQLTIGDEVIAEEPSDTATTLRLNDEVSDLRVDNKSKSETYRNVDFIENNDIATEVTAMPDHRKSKRGYVHYLIQLFLHFFKWLVQVK